MDKSVGCFSDFFVIKVEDGSKFDCYENFKLLKRKITVKPGKIIVRRVYRAEFVTV